MKMIVCTLVELLRPNQIDTLHDVALQVLLKLAPTGTEFKTSVNELPSQEKEQLEMSVKQFALKTQQAAAPSSTPSKLNLDFSKYN